MAYKLFGAHIEKCCQYCDKGHTAPDEVMVLCRRSGPVSPHYVCRHFGYNPLLRIPKRAKKLPDFAAEDFSIE